jgi:integrase
MNLTSFSPASSIVPRVALATAPLQTPEPRQALTLDALIDLYMQSYAGRDKAMGWRLQVWRDRLGARDFTSITTSEIRDALRAIAAEPARVWRGIDADGKPIHKAIRKQRSSSTVNRYHALLSGVLQWAIDQEHAPRGWVNPARGIRRGKENPGVVRFLDQDERRRLLDACKACAWPKMYGLVLLALTSGARRGELLQLRWRDVDLERGMAVLELTKNGERGSLVLTPAVVEQLQGFKRGKPEHYVFCSTRDPLKPYAITQLWFSVLRQAKVEKFRFHDLRHSFASALAQDGASLLEIADAMRHKTLKMVQRYSHFTVKTRSALVHRVLGDVR